MGILPKGGTVLIGAGAGTTTSVFVEVLGGHMCVSVFLKPLTEFVYKWFTVHSFYSFFQILDPAMFASSTKQRQKRQNKQHRCTSSSKTHDASWSSKSRPTSNPIRL